MCCLVVFEGGKKREEGRERSWMGREGRENLRGVGEEQGYNKNIV